MSSTDYNYSALFRRLLEGELSSEETEALLEWLGNHELHAEAASLIREQLSRRVDRQMIGSDVLAMLDSKLPDILAAAIPQSLGAGLQNNENKKIIETDRLGDNVTGLQSSEASVRRMYFLRSRWMRYAAAIILISGMAAAIFFLNADKPRQELTGSHIPGNSSQNDRPPANGDVILVLADGSLVQLDSLHNGSFIQQGNGTIIKQNGLLSYKNVAKPPGNSEVVYNELRTNKGRQFSLVLADGSKVWLNAESGIRFPSTFLGNQRTVEVTGEAYFEVASDPDKPFKVFIHPSANETGSTEIEVLGTHFNIYAYQNESVSRITLLEGSVKILNENATNTLKPGQQAQINSGRMNVSGDVDLQEVMAWKNGKFQFGEATDINTVMNQLSRWYNIEKVEYRGKITGHVGGTISRNLNISQVFRLLEMTGSARFTIEGEKVIVSQ